MPRYVPTTTIGQGASGDFLKAPRVRNDAIVRKVLLRYRECWLCGRAAGSGHHIVPKRTPYLGDDVEANIAPLCGSGTTGCHGLMEDCRDLVAMERAGVETLSEAREKLGASFPDETVEYVLRKLGEDWGRWLLATYGRHVPR